MKIIPLSSIWQFLLLVCLVVPANLLLAEDQPTDRWAKDMAAFAKQDELHPTPTGGVVFVGSSSARLWDLEKWFPDLEPAPLNRGFGGSEMEDSVRHVDLLLLKHKPKVIVVYVGDNDLARGKTPERVSDDFAKLVELVHEPLPETQIIYVGIKPSSSRWKLADNIQQTNALIAKQCEAAEYLTFVETWSKMLGDDGKPRDELFRKDLLHLNDDGYAIWTKLVRPEIDKALAVEN